MPVHKRGARRGAEVVQLYVGDPGAAGEPPRQLKGFARVVLRPGQRRTVTLRLDPSSFATWDTSSRRWTVRGGWYRIYVGTSSRNLLRSRSVQISTQSSVG